MQNEGVVQVHDGILVQRALAGDEDAFEALVLRYHTQLLFFITHFIHDYHQAHDIRQQVFLQLYLSLSSIQTDKSLRPWLFQVARHCCLDELRHKRPILFSTLEIATDDEDITILDALPDPQLRPDEWAEFLDLYQHIQTAVCTLPPRCALVITLRYDTQLSFAEIGRVLNLPEFTVKTYFLQARRLLRKALIADEFFSSYK